MMYVVLLAMISAVFAQPPPPACPPVPACPETMPMTCAPPPLPEGVSPPPCAPHPICAVAMADCPGFGSTSDTADYPTMECPELPPCPPELPMACIPPECPTCVCPIPPMCVVAMADCPSN